MLRLIAFSLLALPFPLRAFDELNVKEPVADAALTAPGPLALGPDRLYVLDAGKGLLVFDAAGKIVKQASVKGGAVAVSPSGKVYVADSGGNRVQVLDKDGAPVAAFGSKGNGPGQLRDPRGVAVGPSGKVYVADSGNGRVQFYTGEGIFLGTLGSPPAEFKDPAAVVVDLSETIHVFDASAGRIERFSPSGQRLNPLAVDGDAFTVDPFGTTYVVQGKAAKVLEILYDGSVSPLGTKGARLGQFQKPAAAATDADGTLYVSDAGNKRVQRIVLFSRKRGPRLQTPVRAGLILEGPVSALDVKAAALTAAEHGRFYGFDAQKAQYALLSPQGEAESAFGIPAKHAAFTKRVAGLAFVPGTGLFASQPDLNQIAVFDSTGNVALTFGRKEGIFEKKSKEGNLHTPLGLAVSDKGTIYVADSGNVRVQAFSAQGVFLKGFGPKLDSFQLVEPVAVAWDPEGFLFILDRGARKVVKCETSGKFLEAWGGLEAPIAIALDGRGYVYVLDAGPRLHVFNAKGAVLGSFFSAGRGATDLAEPSAIAFASGKLWVSDPGKAKLLAYNVLPILEPPLSVSTAAAEGTARLRWPGSEDGWLKAYRVYRATASDGPFSEAGTATATEYADKDLPGYATYYYRVAAESKTGVLGPPSASALVYVPGTFNRPPIEITKVDIGNIFSANYKYYLKNPVGSLKLVNNEDLLFKNVKISFALKDFMDYPYDIPLEEIEPKAALGIPLQATLNNRILDVSEDTPIQALFTITYYESGREQRISLAKPLKVYSKNSIVWDKPERLANFVTTKDPPVFDFGRSILSMKLEGGETVARPLRDAAALWDALGAIGLSYVPDAKSPYERVSEDAAFPEDTVQIPRETLKHRTGDCDDLVALCASLFEGASLRTAFLDYPGHLAFMFDTGAGDPAAVGLPEERLVSYGGSYWVPVETTLVGKSFAEATRTAANLYRQMDDKHKVRVIDVHEAWATYEPMTLPASQWNPEAPKGEEVGKRFAADAKALAEDRYAALKSLYGQRLKSDGADAEARVELGLLELEAGKPAEAKKQFEELLKENQQDPAALNNLGSLAFSEGDFQAAEAFYAKAAAADAQDPGILLNRARAAIALKKGAEAKAFLDAAAKKDGSEALQVDELRKEAEALPEPVAEPKP